MPRTLRSTPPPQPARAWGRLALITLALAGGGCATRAPAPGLADLMERPAERALLDGMRAYDDGQYAPAEAALRRALTAGLASPRDRAGAHKLLAFITCTSERVADCEAAFRAARAADPAFVLNRSEAGHPVWGPVYRRVLGLP
jgi:Tfp pilus assembly protein PilF